jgi:uncharacterized protein (DUF362 family)
VQLPFTRREFIAAATGAALARATPPTSPVAIARCNGYEDDPVAKLQQLFDQLGGLDGCVRGKTVTVKLNLTGSPSNRFQGLAPGNTHWVHPKLVGACCHLLGRAGAKRIRLVESGSVPADSLEEYVLNAGWDVRAIRSSASVVEFERTNNLGKGKQYARLKVPAGALMFPAFDVNHAYEETDVFVSMAKLKEHLTCGVTLSLKNVFGITPTSIYGDDAGETEPNERARHARLKVMHMGERPPSRSAPQALDPHAPLDAGYRIPRVVVDLVAARPVHLAIIDGVETITASEGPWASRSVAVRPGVLIAGLNPVSTDAVGTAVMGYNPKAPKGSAPFATCDNTLLLAEQAGLGSADLDRIEVRGASIQQVRFDFAAHRKA